MIAQSPVPPALNGASLEDLMKIDVTSVSKKDQTLSRTGAAVFVIGQEDIRRSGATSIPDVLRMAPGVEVAQINANQWAISIRGFNAVYSNKVLVLIDGRTLYSQSFSGVFWDEVDTPLEDIERIEVIRGPGGTVWGANAVNGVINIITKSAADSKGGVLVAGSGSQQTAQGILQYGGDAGSQGAWRMFGKYFNDDNSPAPGGGTAVDGWHTTHFGSRADWGLASGDTVSLQGDFLTGAGGTTSLTPAGFPPVETQVNTRVTNRSGDVLARWEHPLAGGSRMSFQAYDNAIGREQYGESVAENTLDLEFEHHLTIGQRHDVVWGLGFRRTREDLFPLRSDAIHVNVQLASTSLFSAFAQDEIQVSGSVFLTLGAKLERNAYTGFEPEPSAQLVWNKSARQTWWASAARAIREPDTLEHGMTFELGTEPVPEFGNALLVLSGNPSLQAEQLTDFETGYRAQLNRRLSFDATGFLSFYRHLVTTETGTPYVTFSQDGASQYEPLLIIPLEDENLAHAREYGLELFGSWQVTNRWKISPGVSFLRMHLAENPGGNDSMIGQTGGDSPRAQAELRSSLNLPRNIEWDSSLKYVDSLDVQGIRPYLRFDTRFGLRLGERTEFNLIGQNLTSGGHYEFVDNSLLTSTSEVARSVSVKWSIRF